jgi:glycosyltransferase involved in cell wall biosynthesis
MNTANIPLLTVCIITYNHEKFICETLDSVLMQKTNFAYKILIGEDCSTDDTREILLEYKQKHPDKIDLLLNKKNMGPTDNLMNVHRAANTKYIAMLDGDDYWTDPDKLQIQVDFLEKNQNYAGCFHTISFNTIDSAKRYLYPENVKQDSFTAKDVITMIGKKWLIMTSSIVYNKTKTGNLPDWMYQLKIGDIPINLLIADAGNVFYMSKVMAAYRENVGSLMTTKAYNNTNIAKQRIHTLNLFNQYTGSKYAGHIFRQLLALYYELIKDADLKKNTLSSLYYSVCFNYFNLRLKHLNKPKNLRNFLLFFSECLRYLFVRVQHGGAL